MAATSRLGCHRPGQPATFNGWFYRRSSYSGFGHGGQFKFAVPVAVTGNNRELERRLAVQIVLASEGSLRRALRCTDPSQRGISRRVVGDSIRRQSKRNATLRKKQERTRLGTPMLCNYRLLSRIHSQNDSPKVCRLLLCPPHCSICRHRWTRRWIWSGCHAAGRSAATNAGGTT